MRIKKTISVLMVITLLMISFIGCGSKSIKVDFIENIIGEEYVVSAFENNEGIIKANLTGNLSRESVEDIVKEIYSKAKQDKVKEEEIILNVYKDGENKEFVKAIEENMAFNIEIFLEKGTYTIKSVNEVKNVNAGDEIGNYSNNKLISAKDSNLEIEIDMSLEELSNEEIMKRMKTYVKLFLDTNSDKDIESIKLNVNNKDNNSYLYDTKMEETLVIVDKEVKISE
ncbi:MAG: hypothetical protein KIC66_12590 [Clostridium sp.]|uniref:hypothetical protein n=1 Tax=Clostridium sp. TaxID=1506 RepID=UPI0025C1C50D|nr:hypothetical protein [Clostridium sp.]MBS5927904.1 hypothetical protein [Clostridium sp.]